MQQVSPLHFHSLSHAAQSFTYMWWSRLDGPFDHDDRCALVRSPRPAKASSFQDAYGESWCLAKIVPTTEVASPCMVLESGQFLSRSTNTATCQELHWSWWVRGHGHCSSIKCPGWWEITLDLRWFCYSWVHAAKAKWGFVHLLLWIFRSQSVWPKHAKKVSWLLPAIFAFRMWFFKV